MVIPHIFTAPRSISAASLILLLFSCSLIAFPGLIPHRRANDAFIPEYLEASLVAYWKLDETTGNRLDSIGSNDAVAYSTPGYAAGKIGNAVDLETGNTEYLKVTDDAAFTWSGEIAVSVWAKPESLSADAPWVIGKTIELLGGKAEFSIAFTTSAIIAKIAQSDQTVKTLTWSSAPSAGTWYHIVLIADGTNAYLYVGNTLRDTAAYDGTIYETTGEIWIGNDVIGAGEEFDGLVDEVGIWTDIGAITATQRANFVATLYNSGAGRNLDEIQGTAPAITSLSVATGPEAGGTETVIAGTGFTYATGVSFGATSATSFTVDSAVQITATSPAGTGTVRVSVTNAVGTSPDTSADDFEYASATGPTDYIAYWPFDGDALDAVADNDGTVNSATLTAGLHNVADTAYHFDGSTADITIADDASLAIEAGSYSISLWFRGTETTKAMFGATAGDTFMMCVLSSKIGLYAGTGSWFLSGATGTTTVTDGGWHHYVAVFTGSHYLGYLDGAAEIDVTESTAIRANGGWRIGSFASGSWKFSGDIDDVKIFDRAISATEVGEIYDADKVSYISAIAPATGPTAGGTEITITGKLLTGATDVDFGATAASAYTVDSDTQITATSPAGSAGTVQVKVTTALGSTANTAADDFVYADPEPNYYAADAGTTSINGTYLDNGTVNGKNAWKKADNSGYLEYDGYMGWQIASTTMGMPLYTTTSSADAPPTTGWSAMFGDAPAPTITHD